MSQYPVISAGQLITGSLLRSMFGNEAVKGSDTTKTSTITMGADSDLTFSVVANGVYDVELELLFSGATAGGIRTRWTFPTGATGQRMVQGPGSSASDSAADNIAVRHGVHLPNTIIVYSNVRNSAASLVYAIERCRLTIAATAGSVGLEWAQGASNATGTVLAAGSRFKYRRIG